MRTQPQARVTKQQARINRFKELKGEVHQTVNNDDLEINFETSRIGKKVVNFEQPILPLSKMAKQIPQ